MNGWISGVSTLLALLAFLAVVLWAYSSRRKADFERAARLPFDDEEK